MTGGPPNQALQQTAAARLVARSSLARSAAAAAERGRSTRSTKADGHARSRRRKVMVELLPGHERRPAHPLPEGPRPGTRYRVQDNDDWQSVAAKHKVSVKELIANNCGLNVTPEEINWYLHIRVGCNVTHDRKNWSFSNSANPGFIYAPAPGTVPTSAQNPQINTWYAGPKDLGCGGVEWLVEFRLPRKAESDGWIIQQVQRSYDIRNSDGKVADVNLNAPKATFWEAWPVKKGEIMTSNRYDATADGRTYDDSFDQPARPN